MNDIGFVVPLENEAKILIEDLTDKKRIICGQRKIIIGKLLNKKVSLIISGCGKIKSASATQLLIDRSPAKLYIHFGTSGALSPILKIGDVVAASEVVEHDVEELFPQEVPPPVHKLFFSSSMTRLLKKESIIMGRIISGDKDIVRAIDRDKIYKQYKGLTVDWESAGFALTCQLNKVQGIIFRGVSDYAHEKSKREYEINQQFAIKNIYDLIKVIVMS